MGAVVPDLDRLRQQLEQSSVPSVFPGAPEFEKLAQSYNRVFSYKPAVVCLPEKDDDVVNAIKSARAHGVKVQPKGGGHSYGAFSSGGQDGSLILYMKSFSVVHLNTETNIAVVGAGVRLGQLSTELFRQGRRAVPHGTIKNVGVAGHFSHGGYGYQSRAWGLAVDSICGLDVVLADGRLLHVTATDHPELFYAFRGAADSFGVILRFHLSTVPAPEEVVLFSYDIEGIVENVDEAVSAFLNIQQVVQDANVIDRDLSFGFYIHDGSWTIWGVFLRSQAEFEDKVSVLRSANALVSNILGHDFLISHGRKTLTGLIGSNADRASPARWLQATCQEVCASHGMVGCPSLVLRQSLQRCHRGGIRHFLCTERTHPGTRPTEREGRSGILRDYAERHS